MTVKWLNSLKPIQLLIYGYLTILMLGFLLLCIPVFHQISVATLDNFFIATSAFSTTGLATVDIGTHYNLAGQILILLLIQLGGLGYMSIGSFIVLLRRKRLSKRNSELILYDFSLPKNFSVLQFVKNLMLFSILIEIFGAVILSAIFYTNGVDDFIWKGIFHSISAYCTAGFSLFSNNLVDFGNNFYLNATVSFLSICGALGFIVFTDFFERLSGKKEHLTFTSKIILRFTFLGILLGTFILFLTDMQLQSLAPEDRIMGAFFQSMAAFTTVGFNTYDIGAIAPAPIFFLTLLMIVGASPSGTGGGMKSTTLTALYAQLKSTFRGDDEVIYMHRKIPEHRVRMATSNFFFYVIIICFGIFLLLLTETHQKFAIIFEGVSALGTVGLSTGITSELSTLGKLIITIMMFLGRIGPLTFGIALFSPSKEEIIIEEDLAI